MIFIAQVEWSETSTEEHTSNLYLTADNYVDATERLISFYGEDMTSMSLTPFTPDSFLEFDMSNIEEMELFYDIKNILGEKVIW